ncbi:MAG: ATP-binding cassette domain-containing protein [Verrucomicrobiales bacterium]
MSENAPTSPFISVSGLRKSFGAHEVLKGLDFQIAEGETTVVLGGSGAGKSVLLKHLNGLLHPDRGSVEVEGVDIASLSERALGDVRRRIGIVFQGGALFDSMTVGENVAFPLIEAGLRNVDSLRVKVSQALETVGLSGEEEKLPASLSGGMRKRAALARAIVARPKCLLYDEPTAELDPLLARTIIRLIRRLKEEFSLTSVVVTHDLEAMRAVADRVLFLKDGKVRFAGTPAELKDCGDPFVFEFLDAGGGRPPSESGR